MTMHQEKIALLHIGQLATPLGNGPLAGEAQGSLQFIQDAYILIENGLIKALGAGVPSREALEGYRVIDTSSLLVTPGLVDAHTHLVFGGWRAHEMAQKIAGVPYLDILAGGGGILDTVRKTRAASLEELIQKAVKALDQMLSLGTTTVEAKSGYGLNLEDELKQLQAAKALNGSHAVDIVSTLMAAHAVPPEYKDNRQGFIDLITQAIIPAAAKENLASFCDVFCEEGVFNVEESRQILQAGQQYGLKSKIHADEIHPIGGSELAGELGATSAEHLISILDTGIEAMQTGGTIACLLPATSLYLGKPFAPAQKMIASGVPVAIASDFNPGSCPSLNLQLCINLACLYYRMTPAQVLTAVTLNAAAAIGKAEQIGSLEAGKQADLVIWDAEDLDFLCYRMGSNLVHTVIKAGRVVYRQHSSNQYQ